MTFLEPLLATPYGALLIFLFRVIDVSMMTIRTIFAVRGRRVPAMILGFFQMLFWLVAVSAALKHIDSLPHMLGYAVGFAAGNYVGVWFEQWLAIGTSVVRVVVPSDAASVGRRHAAFVEQLRAEQFALTQVPARGWKGEVDVVDVIVPRRDVPRVLEAVEQSDPDAFVSVESIDATRGRYPAGMLPAGATPTSRRQRAA